MLKIDPRKLRWLQVRMVGVGILFLVGFGFIVRRAYNLQIGEHTKFRGMAEEQYLRSIELPARRGMVFDRTGSRLALSADVDSICANPRGIGDDAPIVAARLSEVLKVSRKEVERKLQAGRYFTWIARRVEPEAANQVVQLGLEGVTVTKEPKRFYPSASLAGPLLGFADADAKGIEGVELSLDGYLRGERVAAPGFRDALGREVLTGGMPNPDSGGGADVQLTLDRFIQFAAERSLATAIEKHKAKAGSVTVLDSKTGDVLAMATWPTYDPNHPGDAAKRNARNRPVTDAYEPGSTLKTFSIAAAIEAGVVRPSDTWDCMQGKMKLGSFIIHDTHPYGSLSTIEVLAKSSNIGAAKIANKLGRRRLEAFLRKLGFGQPTGIELPGEAAGRLKPAARWSDSDLATIAFGQSLTTTPLQLVQALGAMANHGILHPPRLVRRIVDHEGKVVMERKAEGRQVMSPESAAIMVEALGRVTDRGGTAETLVLPGYKIAGKTGTAQKVDPLLRRYSTDKWVSSFMGFVPAEDPRLVLLVVIDEPQGSHYGSVVAAPVFRDVAEQALKYLGVPPRRDELAQGKTEPKRPAKGAAAAEQIPMVEESVPDEPSEGETRVPDFTGMSIAEAISAAHRAGLDIDPQGSGRAVGQEPGPGGARDGTVCHIEFRPPG